jgi:hypothetical protein
MFCRAEGVSLGSNDLLTCSRYPQVEHSVNQDPDNSLDESHDAPGAHRSSGLIEILPEVITSGLPTKRNPFIVSRSTTAIAIREPRRTLRQV